MSTTFLQGAQQGFAATTGQVSLQYASNVTAGSLLVAVIGAYDTSVSNPLSVSDSVNGTWTQAGSYEGDGAGHNMVSLWYFANSAGGSKPTLNVSSSHAPALNNYYGLCIGEWSVPNPTGVSVDGSSTNTGSGTSVTTGSVPVAGAGELVIAGLAQGIGTATDYTVAGPFTMREKQLNGTTNQGAGMASDENASAAEGATFTLSGVSGVWVAIGVSFITGSAAPVWIPPGIRNIYIDEETGQIAA